MEELIKRLDSQHIIVVNGIIYEIDDSDVMYDEEMCEDRLMIYVYDSFEDYYENNYNDSFTYPVSTFKNGDLEFINE